MKFNATSIALSWAIAIGFLSLVSLIAQPARPAGTAPSRIELPAQITSAPHSSLDFLKASAWCALGSGQSAILKTTTGETRFQGSMAIAPHWLSQALHPAEQARLDNCIALRMEQLEHFRTTGQQPALAFLFSGR